MGRGFLAGMLLGLLVVAGLAVLAGLMLPPPGPPGAPPEALAGNEADQAEGAAGSGLAGIAPPVADTPAPEPLAQPTDLPAAPPEAEAAPGQRVAPEPPTMPGAGADRPAALAGPVSPAVGSGTDLAAPAGEAVPPAAAADRDAVPSAPALPGPPAPADASASAIGGATPGPPAMPRTPPAASLPQEAASRPATLDAEPEPEAGPLVTLTAPPASGPGPGEALPSRAAQPPAPSVPAAQGAGGSDTPPAQPAPAPAQPDAPRAAEGDRTTPQRATAAAVVTDRLPRIGPAPTAEGPSTEGAPAGALARNRVAFVAPDGPRLALVLAVVPGDAEQQQAIAALPFPVTVAIDPAAPDAGAAAAAFRAAGREVVVLATEIPEGATPADLEVTFGAHLSAVPAAVAVLDTAAGSVQASRLRAQQVAVILAAEGYGLLTDEGGLNTGAQVAGGIGLPHAGVARRIAEVAELRQGLERAAFRAAQRGAAAAVIAASPALLSELAAWHAAGRAEGLALVPVSLVLERP